MAEPIVASIVKWIGSILLQEANALFEVADQVKGLQQELELMQEYLQDADTKQESGVQTLVCQIRMLAYEAEDVIDTYILKVPAVGENARFRRYGRLLYNAHDIYKVTKQIHATQSEVQRMYERLNSYGVRRIVPSLQKCFQPSYPFEVNNNEYIVGIERDVSKLLPVLMSEGNSHINILSIVGMGGSGKTTLARKLYNHPSSKECYNCMSWVYISQECSIQHILSEILRKVSGYSYWDAYEINARLSREELVEKLRFFLKGKTYLVILDDLWRREDLEEILPALPFEEINRGSKIIITTRNRDTVHFQNLQYKLYVHEPQPLSEEESWLLFSKLALSHRTDCGIEDFEGLAKVMLNNCGGLPLAIVALAGILKTRTSIGEWQHVSEVVRSKVMRGMCSNTRGSVQDLLALSYDDLSYDLKLCFLYLGVFPEDYQIPVGMLTRMWIAEGLVTGHEGMSPEDIAKEHIEELSHRSMIQVVRTNFNGAIKAFQLHDLLRDLCLRKAKKQNFLQIYAGDCNEATNYISIAPRRAALHSSISFPTDNSNLRSLVLLMRSSIQHSACDSKVMLDLNIVHHNFKLLRLLNLWGIMTDDGTLPEQVGSLTHLRYLGLRASNITALPCSIGKLRNLLTLDYRNIISDKKIQLQIPNVIEKLLLLRHLFLPMEYPWSTEGVLHLSNLKNIRTLWGVRYNKKSNSFSREMEELSTTVRKLKVYVATPKILHATFNCPSLRFDRLHTFYCEWESGFSLRPVNSIAHNQLLHKLVLVGKIEVKELSIILPTNLVILELVDSVLEDEDPILAAGKLPHLKYLRLKKSYLGTTSACEITSFPVLEELFLENLPLLKTWSIQKGAMPCLKKLMISRCTMLSFPQHLPSANLQQLGLFEVPEEFRKKADASGLSKLVLRLHQSLEAIISQSHTVKKYSTTEFIQQLAAGFFINYGFQKVWVVRNNDHYQNCFMLYTGDVSTYHPSKSMNSPFGMFCKHKGFKHWTKLEDREKGSAIQTINKPFQLQAEIVTAFLSPNVTYEIVFEIMLPQCTVKNLSGSAICYLLTSNPSSDAYFPRPLGQPRNYRLHDKPRDEWIRLEVGELNPSFRDVGNRLVIQLETKEVEGMVIKGVLIQPKHCSY